MKEPVLEFAFSGGIDESTREEIADAARTFPTLENGRQDKRGGYSKRLGYGYLTTSRLDASARTAGRKLFSHSDRCCVIDGTYLDVYSETAAVWSTIGRVPEASYRLLDAPSTSGPSDGTASDVEDVAIANGCVVILHNAGGYETLSCSVMDLAGTILRAPEAVRTASTGTRIRGALGSYGNVVCLIATDGLSANVRLYTLDCTSAATITTGWTDRGNVATDQHALSASPPLAVASMENRVAFAYVNNSAGTDQATVKTVTTAGVVETRTVNTSSTRPGCVALEGSVADTLWFAWNETTSVKVIGLDADNLAATLATAATALSPASAPTNVHVVTTGTGAGRVYANDPTTDLALSCRPFTTSAGAVSLGTGNGWYSVFLASKPYVRSGRVYGFVYAGGEALSTNSQGIYVLADLDASASTVRPVVNPEPGLCVAPISKRAALLASGTKLYTVLSLTRGNDRAAVLLEVDFASSTLWHAVSHGGSTFLTGGVTSKFDGSRLREAGIIVAPSKPTSVQNAGAVLNPASGYHWVAVYEAVDGDGNWVVSGASLPSDPSATGACASFTVTTSTLTCTSRFSTWNQASAERVTFYRDVSGGSVFYRVGSVPNSTNAATVSFTDATTDANLIAAAKLYGTGAYPGTAGAGQDRRAPPGFTCLVSYNDMLVGATGSTLWHSSQSVVGEAVWFNPLFRLDMVDGGEVTALAAQDGTLYVFKRRSIFAVTGEPPADNGSSGGLGTPRKLAADVGCIDPRSVVVTALGVFFQSERGLELLSRGQSVEWIGEQVQETLSSFPVITSATLDSAHALVRFTCAASETDNVVGATGVHLVYDLTLRTWVSVDKVYGSGGGNTAAQSASMVYVGGAWRYAWLDPNGFVYSERRASDGDAHLDESGTQWVTMRAATANVHIAGLQGEQNIDRLLMLAERHTDHDFTIEIAHDYASSYTESKTFPASLLSTLGRQWLDRELLKSTSQAIRVRLTDATPSSGTVGTGKGATWVALTFSGERKSGVKRTTSAQRGS